MTDKNDDATDDDAGTEQRFGLAIQIWHPDLDPRVLTEALGRVPFRCWRAGEARTTMRGDKLPGHWPQSYWVASRMVEGRRDFFAAMDEEIVALERCAALVRRLVAEGGRVYVKVELPGDTNLGDLLSASTMRRLGALDVDLAVEVFPDMD